MKTTLNGTSLRIESDASDQWNGSTYGKSVEQHPTAGRVLRCGTVKIGRKSQTLVLRLNDKPELAATVDAWVVAVTAEQEAEAAAKQKEIDDLRSGAAPVELRYHDGEYLSGHEVHGPAADMLVRLGLAKDVSGWGTSVNDDVVKALGTTFTLPQAEEYARPKLEAAAAKSAAKKAETEAHRKSKFDEAKATGRPVEIQQWSEPVTGRREVEEGNSLDIVYEYAMPDGTTQTKRHGTY